MKINFGDTVPMSTLDWPGKAAITLFLRECVFECPYCQNHELLNGKNLVSIEEIKSRIDESKKFIDGVVVSGGEPLIQIEALKQLAVFSKKNGLGFALHTNGYFPNRIKELTDEDYLDFVSLDIKAPLNHKQKYQEICGAEIEVNRIKESYEMLRQSSVELEITTTFFGKKITREDIEEIANHLKNEKYVLQQGRTENAFKEEYKKLDTIDKHSLLDLAQKIDYENLYVRTKKEGEEKV